MASAARRFAAARGGCAPAARLPRRARPRAAQATAVSATVATPSGVAPFESERGCGDGVNVKVSVADAGDGTADALVRLTASAPGGPAGLAMHWAVLFGEDNEDWCEAPEGVAPAGSRPFGDNIATRTPFVGDALEVRVPAALLRGDRPVSALVGILVREHGGAEDDWLHADDGASLRAPIMDAAALAAPKGAKLARRAAQRERDGDMNQLQRYNMALEAMAPEGDAQPGDASAMAVLYAHIKLATSRALPLYEGNNYQGKDMVHQAENMSTQTALRAADASRDDASRLARQVLSQLPRGGGGGDDIRMGILNIMRDNGIKEGHRPGIECRFIAQWHQKLHSATTPDDIGICEAYLNFLRGGGDWDGDFYGHLGYHAGLTREDLQKMTVGWRNEDGITGPAVHLPHLVQAFEWFLRVLKKTHSGAQLDSGMKHAGWTMDEGLQYEMQDLINNRDEHWVPGKIVELRSRLQHSWLGAEDRYQARDALMLDIALDEHFRKRIEATDVGSLGYDEAAGMLQLCLENGALATSGDTLCKATGLWRRVLESGGEGRWGDAGWLQLATAALDAVKLSLEKEMDELASAVQVPGETIGRAAGVDEAYLANFGEEVVRGHPMFVCSRLVQRLEGVLRECAGVGPWTSVSLGSGNGVAEGALLTSELATLQGAAGATAVAEASGGTGGVVLLSEGLDGLEDVPPGVVAVLSRSSVDLLSHVALRARQSGALLACCADEGAWGALVAAVASSEGQGVRVTVDSSAGHVALEPASGISGTAAVPAMTAGASGAVATITPSAAWALTPASYAPGVVGGKSSNLAVLGGIAEQVSAATAVDVCVPPSVALPFGAFDRALGAAENAPASEMLDVAIEALGAASCDRAATNAALAAARAAIERLALPAGLVDEVRAAAEAASAYGIAAACDVAAEPSWWPEVRRVWASKWNERAHASRAAMGVADADLHMAVLLMELVPAEYAFVLHSRNPVAETPAPGEMLGEVVVGLGETLVGNHPGAPLCFTATAPAGAPAASNIGIRSLPSKLDAMRVVASDGGFSPLICRSDSNGEDLEGFAGAGLYDSFSTAGGVATSAVDYGGEQLLWDGGFQGALCDKLARVASALEAAMGGPQDVEGAVVGDTVYLLQARPQQV